MQPLHIKTPFLQSQSLKNKLDKEVYFKLELLQPSGSFKLRGIGALCQYEWQRGSRRFVASSGGNGGVAVAYCGMKLGIKTTVFIPKSSHSTYINAIKAYGAEVIVAGEAWDDAHIAAMDFSARHQAAYTHPFDHPVIWQGHATLIEEMVASGFKKPDLVIVSVGGGGLACGVLEGMHQHGWHEVPMVAVETVGADAFSQSIKANQLVTLPAITSQATSLGAKRVTSKLMDWSKKHNIQNVVVSDEGAKQGSIQFARDQRMLVELSSGASLSLVYNNHPVIHSAQSILVVVCGGVNVSHFGI
jgi:L-serine/L-threonine ammonia-lyase